MLDRTTGLKDLIHILKHNRGKPSLEALGNKAYLALCETLFQCLRDERASFVRNRARTTKAAALLPLSASALRHVIASGVRTIKSSTVEIIIDTIIEVLPANGGLVEPLLEDLPKTLRSLLEYQPHVERLSKGCWDEAIDFCIDSLASFFSEPSAAEGEPQNSWSSNASHRARTPLESADFASFRASPHLAVSRTKSAVAEHVYAIDDFVHCIHHLVRASNAPLLDRSEAILAALLRYLQHKTGRGSVVVAALAAVNSVLARTALQSLELTKRTTQQLLPLLKSMWSDAILRDEILITLTYTEAHIASLLTDPHDETSADLEALVETMYSDYRRRQETTAHQYLEEDHLCFRHLGSPADDTHPLNTYAFSLEPEHQRYEGLWSIVAAIARFSFILDKRRRTITFDRSDTEESVSKRPRISQLFSEYLRHVSEPRSNAKRAALQIVAFMVQEGPFDEEELQPMLEKLTSCISDENPVHSVWAMIGLAG